MGWRDNAKEDNPRVAASTIGDGEEMDVKFTDDGQETETEAGDAVEFSFTYLGGTGDFTEMGDGPELEEGNDYILLTSSSRLLAALASVADSLSGVEATITADGSVDSFKRTYDVTTE